MDPESLAHTVDKSQMPPLHQKRVLAFINHFIINSCNFLNDFAMKCETKFIDLERKMQKVDAALTIIEAKLSSVPDIQDTTAAATANGNVIMSAAQDTVDKTENKQETIAITADSSPTIEPIIEDSSTETTGVRACDDVRFKKFFKMVQFGVPAEAVKMKMQAEGVEPSLLDTPNLLLADGVID
ncbi:WASH complex subunit 3 isoform X1 [Ceratitis capitata]|uniref:WASH complex subunit CCDC53 n=1 Tax=Ceratitis capitata TaxID=7213 RepID=W8C4L4_CERCA|nr:WASH complex subunit 3 isoform X1 [Ceratitis capitata]